MSPENNMAMFSNIALNFFSWVSVIHGDRFRKCIWVSANFEKIKVRAPRAHMFEQPVLNMARITN
jgi:hypothetical protein